MVDTNRIALFVGPTAHGVDLEGLDRFADIFPPVQRNDLDSLESRYNIIAIVDGYFNAVPSVGHAELRRALRTRTVYGAASIGAIRACEMRDLGMIGVGTVYDTYLNEDDFTDDEVALLHGPAPEYLPLSEPLVNLRAALKRIVDLGLVDEAMAYGVLADLKNTYFGDRTWRRFWHLVGCTARASLGPDLREFYRDARVKQQDLERLIHLLRVRYAGNVHPRH